MRAGSGKAAPVILALFIGLYIVPLSLRPLSAPDEYRYGEVAREMIASGDWIVPRLNGMPYFEKPVLGYWLIGVSILGLGESAWAIRLPSAVATGATAVLLFLLLRRFGRDRREGPLAAAAWLTTLLPFAVGVMGILDGILTFFVTATMTGLYLALQEESSARRRWWLVGAGLAAGCAFMTKGPIGWALPAVSLVPWLVIRGRVRQFARLSWLPASVALAVVGPWAIAVHLRSGFWYRFIVVENLQRFVHPGRDQHPAGPGYYAVYLIPAALPWVFLLPAALKALWRRRGEGGAGLSLLAALWFAVPFVLLSASSGKLLTYILPCIVPLLILVIRGGSHVASRETPGRGLRWAAGLMGGAGAALSLALLAGMHQRVLNADPQAGGSGDEIIILIGTVGWVAAGLAGALARNGWSTLRWIAVAPLLFLIGAHALGSEGAFHGSPEELIRRNLARAGPRVVLVGDSTVTQALCWITGRDDVFVFGGAGEMEYGFDQTESREPLDPEGLRRLIEQSDTPVVLAMRWARWEHYRTKFPQLVSEERDNSFVAIVFRAGGEASAAGGDPPLPARQTGAHHGSMRERLDSLGDESPKGHDSVPRLEDTDDEPLEAGGLRYALHLGMRGQDVVSARIQAREHEVAVIPCGQAPAADNLIPRREVDRHLRLGHRATSHQGAEDARAAAIGVVPEAREEGLARKDGIGAAPSGSGGAAGRHASGPGQHVNPALKVRAGGRDVEPLDRRLPVVMIPGMQADLVSCR